MTVDECPLSRASISRARDDVAMTFIQSLGFLSRGLGCRFRRMLSAFCRVISASGLGDVLKPSWHLWVMLFSLPLYSKRYGYSRFALWLGVGWLGFMLSGCVTKPPPVETDFEAPSRFLNESAGDSAGLPEPAAAVESWWQVFESERLDRLVRQAEESNQNLLAAFQSVEQARAIVRGVRADYWPQVDASLSGEARDPSASLGGDFDRSDESYEAGIFVGWEVDLFGRVRYSARAAVADAEAQAELYQDLLLTLQADVATLYFEVALLETELEIVQRSVETRRESADLVGRRFEAGTVTELDVAQAEALLASAEAEAHALRRAQNSRLYALAVLVGETPATFDFQPQPLQAAVPVVTPGIPAGLLARRPDVREAEQSLSAASSRIAVSKASFFPRLSLNAALGQASTDWDSLFDDDNAFSLIGGAAGLPLFQGGRLRADLQRAKANYQAAWHRFKQTALEAIAEVEDQLQSLLLLSAEREALARSFNAYERARQVSLAQYESGVLDFFALLDAERSALQAEQQLAQLRGQELISTVNLIRALGGTW